MVLQRVIYIYIYIYIFVRPLSSTLSFKRGGWTHRPAFFLLVDAMIPQWASGCGTQDGSILMRLGGDTGLPFADQ